MRLGSCVPARSDRRAPATRPRGVVHMSTVSRGSVFRRKGTENWFIKFYVDGKLKRESSGSRSREQALEYLRRRVDQAMRGHYTDVSQRPTFAEMQAKLVENYEFKRNKTEPTRFSVVWRSSSRAFPPRRSPRNALRSTLA